MANALNSSKNNHNFLGYRGSGVGGASTAANVAAAADTVDSDHLGGMIVDLDNVDAIINYVIKMQYICSE